MESSSHSVHVGLGHHQAGRLREAEQLYRQALTANPRDPLALHLLGLVAHQVGQHEAAIELIGQAIGIDGDRAEYHCNLGEVLRTVGRVDQARGCYERSLELDPTMGPAHYNLGLLLHQSGSLALARKHYEVSARLQPNHADTHYNLGNLLRMQDDLHGALAAYHQALRCRGEHVEVLNHLGVTLTELKRFAEAAEYLRRSLAIESGSAATHVHLANAWGGEGKFTEATACLDTALRLAPNCVPAYCALGSVRRAQGDFDAAIVCFEQALRLDAECATARIRLAALYRDLGLLDQSESCYKTALRSEGAPQPDRALAVPIRHDRASALSGLGMLELTRGELPKAADYFRQALQVLPAHTDARLGLGMARLGQGDWADAWPDYEEYLQIQFGSRQKSDEPRWHGSPLAGRTILVDAHFGFGDVLNFIRYCPAITSRGGRVLIEVHDKLAPLLGQSGFDNLVPLGSTRPKCDAQVSLLSLPGIFQTTLETVPADIPYLVADAGRVARWAARLKKWRGFKIGIHWQGNTAYSVDRYRSLPLEGFVTLAQVPNVTLFSLQKGTGSQQVDQVADRFAVHCLDDLDEHGGAFLDSAAVMKNLDLVICCDSAIGHLAGSLGVPVWVALSTGSDWRWVRDHQDTPWYPTMRLFRQSKFGQWPDVFERMAGELRELASRHTEEIQ